MPEAMPTASSDVRVGAAVLTFCGADDVVMTVRALTDQTRPPDRVIVVDNNSPDATLERVEEGCPGVEVLARADNAGYGAAMNDAVARLEDCDLVLLLTQECRLAPDALEHLVEAVTSAPDVVAAGPLLALRSAPDVVWSAGGTLRGRRLAGRHLGAGAPLAEAALGPVSEVEWLDGAAVLLRRDVLVRAGGVRADFFLYWEDVELALRLRSTGGRFVLQPAASAWQETSLTPPYLAARNRTAYLRGERRWVPLTLVVAEVVAQALRDSARGARRRARLRLTGLRDGFSGRLDRGICLERS